MTGETEPLSGLGQDRRVLDERYELVERIGMGGMAEVWRARDKRLERDVAVKLLPATASEDGSRRRKIEREARALAASNHPNIVSVYDYGEATSESDPKEVVPYLVMELVAGPDLHQYLTERGPLPVLEATDLIAGVLAGVAHAHEAGVVHGDLKPANVFMSPHGPKVGDFGVARILDEESTGSTTVAATPTFAAPEVLKGERATASSDVYSAACLAFQLLAGKPPFEGANAWDVASKHIEAAVPKVKKIRTDVPPQLDAAIYRGMDKNPRRRHDGAASFADALCAAGMPATTPPVATVPVSAASVSDREATQALTRPRPNATHVALLGPFAGLWSKISSRARHTVERSPNRRVLLLLLIPLLLVVAFIAMSDPGPDVHLVPDLVGERYQDAVAELREQGFIVDVAFRPITEGTPGRVLDTIPAAKEAVPERGEVHVIAGALAATPTPAPVVTRPTTRDVQENQTVVRRRGKDGGKKND
jgi:serine/threonine-protein kinase